MEISTWHEHLTVCLRLLKQRKTDVKFVISKDAPFSCKNRRLHGSCSRIIEAGLDFERVVNLMITEQE